VSERGRLTWVLATIVAMLWNASVVAVYYVFHKPFTVSQLVAVGRSVAGLIGAGMVVVLGTGIGLLLLERLDLKPLERMVWAAPLGLGVVSLIGLGLGAVGLLQPWLLWSLTVVGFMGAGCRLLRALREAWADRTWRPQGRFEIFLAGYCGITLVIALAWALTPPTAWDGLVYHLTGPKLYLATGRISHSLDLPYLGFPQLTEMLFTWAMGLVGESAAAPIHWFYGVFGVLVLVSAGRRWLGGRTGWLAAAVLLSARSIVLLAGWPYVDLALLLYATLAFLALACAFEEDVQSHRWLALSGAYAGLALSTKYTALALLPALGLVLLVFQASDSGLGTHNLQLAAREWLLVGGIALFVWSPWLVKNFLLTGNPTYPFFFGGVYWDDWRAWWYDRPGTGLLYTAPWKLLTAPWDTTVWGREGLAGYSATVGPLFLMFLPFLLLVWRRLPTAQRRWLRAALVFCGVLYGFWLWGVARTALLMQTRLLFPAFGLLALIVGAAVGLRSLPLRPLDLGWLARAIVLGVLGLTLVASFLSTVQAQPLGVLLGHESRGEFLARRLGWYYAALEYINQELPPDAVVLFLWEPRSYHCAVDCRPDTLLDRFLHATRLYGAHADAIATAWRAKGVTNVLFYQQGFEMIHEAGFDPVTEADVVTLEALRRHHLQGIQEFGSAYVLYELR